MSKTQVSLSGGLQTKITTRHHTYYSDEPESAGGTDTMVSPVEMTMGALGACVAMTIKLYAERKGWPLEGVDVELEVERFRGRDYPDYDGNERYVHEIRERVTLHGDLSDEQKSRMMEIGGKCPVHRIISTPTFWVEDLVEADTTDPVPE